jgi:hypothetical protein
MCLRSWERLEASFEANRLGNYHDLPYESADIFVGPALGALGCRRLKYRQRGGPSPPFPSRPVQVWCEKFRVLLLPLGDNRSPKELRHF